MLTADECVRRVLTGIELLCAALVASCVLACVVQALLAHMLLALPVGLVRTEALAVRAALAWAEASAGAAAAWTWGLLAALYERSVFALVKYVYLRGPTVLTRYGFWQGRATEDVCAQLTGIDARHWAAHPEPCALRIDQEVGGYLALAALALVALAAYRRIDHLCRHCLAARRSHRHRRPHRLLALPTTATAMPTLATSTAIATATAHPDMFSGHVAAA